jgi:SAM-dependent methyltransferase
MSPTNLYSTNRYSTYDPYADIYNDNYGNKIKWEIWLPLLEELLLQHLPKGAHIFDLCCGTGQLAQQLLMKGYQVTGLDGSERMLSYAHKNASRGNFILGDARSFKFPPTFHAVISSSVALNHVISLEELKDVFRNVYAALLDDQIFLFDLIVEEWFQHWNADIIVDSGLKDEYAFFQRDIYNSEEKIGRTNITIFRLSEEKWQRLELNILVKAYSWTEVKFALEEIGFKDVQIYDKKRNWEAVEYEGNVVFVCRKSASR